VSVFPAAILRPLTAVGDVTGARDGVKELRSAFGPVRATEMVFVTSALYPNIQNNHGSKWESTTCAVPLR
jgi:hypothetical protein